MKIKYLLSVLLLVSNISVADVINVPLEFNASFDAPDLDSIYSPDPDHAKKFRSEESPFASTSADIFSIMSGNFNDHYSPESHGFNVDKPAAHYMTTPVYHHGDVPAVPIPAAVWLFASGFAGLLGFAHRRKTA